MANLARIQKPRTFEFWRIQVQKSAAAHFLREREGIDQHDGAGAEQAPGGPVGRDYFAGSRLRIGRANFHYCFVDGERFDAQQAAICANCQEE